MPLLRLRFFTVGFVLLSLASAGCSCALSHGSDAGPSDSPVPDVPRYDSSPADAGTDAPDAPPAPACEADCWHWVHPTPDGASRWGIWASSASDAWAVGQSGLAHWDGVAWAASGPEVQLRGVWGTSASDVWAVGPGGALHFDGAAWSEIAGAPGGLTAVWGSARGDVWAVGADGVIAHWDGTSWATVESGTTLPVNGVWGLGRTDVWALGGDFFASVLLHWDGATWTPAPFAPGSLPATFRDAWGASSDDVWATSSRGLYHWDGTSWSRALEFGIGLNAVWGRAADDVFVVGPDGFVLHWDGVRWTHVVEGAGSVFLSLYDVTGADGALWAVGYDGAIARWDGTTFAPDNGWTRASLRSVWGASESDVWAVGAGAIGHFDGTRWTSVPSELDAIELNGVWGSDASDVWAVGKYGMGHFDGRAWTSAGLGGEWNAVWGSGASDVWAVGGHTMRGGFVAHFDGAAWTELPMLTAAGLNAVAGSGPSDVWAVGNGGAVLHFDGAGWTVVESGTIADLFGVWAGGANDAWVVGDGLLLHWDGRSFAAPADTGLTRGLTLRSVFGRSASDVWVVGADAILHFDGRGWTQGRGLGAELAAVWGREHLWAVGERAAIVSTLH